MKKKWLALALSAVMAAGTLTACGGSGDGNASSDNQDSLAVGADVPLLGPVQPVPDARDSVSVYLIEGNVAHGIEPDIGLHGLRGESLCQAGIFLRVIEVFGEEDSQESGDSGSAASGEAVTIKFLHKGPKPDGWDAVYEKYLEMTKDTLNVELDINWVEHADYKDKLNLEITSGSLQPRFRRTRVDLAP